MTVELAGPVGSSDVPGAILAKGTGSDGVQHTGEGAAPTGGAVNGGSEQLIFVPRAGSSSIDAARYLVSPTVTDTLGFGRGPSLLVALATTTQCQMVCPHRR